MRASTSTAVRPLLKWAGGKRQLLPVLAEHYPPTFSRYIEPFMGSAAVFFDLLNSGRLARRAIVLADVNPDLIGCYRTLRDRPEAVIRALKRLAREYRDRRERVLLRRARYTLQSAARGAAGARVRTRRRRGHVHARARGDADLPEPHRLQRAVPTESTRRLQRAGRTLHESRASATRRISASVAAALATPGRDDRICSRSTARSTRPARAISSTAIRRMRH